MNVSFPFDTETVQFDLNGNPPGWYDIMNYQLLPDGGYNYVQIGNWKNGTLSIPQGPRKMVTSVCSEPCNTDQVKVTKFLDNIRGSCLLTMKIVDEVVKDDVRGNAVVPSAH